MDASTLERSNTSIFSPLLRFFSFTCHRHIELTMFSPIVTATVQATAIAAVSNVIAQVLEQRSKQVRLPSPHPLNIQSLTS